MSNTFIVIPTYNEADNIAALLHEILALPHHLQVIVVDDGSPDGTGAIVDAIAADTAGSVHAIHRPGKLGLGTAYLAGFQKAFTLGASHIMTMDADFSHHPSYIPSLLALGAQNVDVVIGSRYVPGGATRNWPWQRRFLSWGANLVTHAALGLQARDTTAGFRLYRREVLESLPLETVFSSGYSFLVEMLYLCQEAGWHIGEVPIVFEDRRHGFTKISQREIFKAQYTVLRLFWRRVRRQLGRWRQTDTAARQ